MATSLDDDLDTAILIAQLQLEDALEVSQARKGKARATAPRTDEELAFEIQAQELGSFKQLYEDYALAKSLNDALSRDADLLDACRVMEEAAQADRRVAELVSRGRPVPRPTEAQRRLGSREFSLERASRSTTPKPRRPAPVWPGSIPQLGEEEPLDSIWRFDDLSESLPKAGPSIDRSKRLVSTVDHLLYVTLTEAVLTTCNHYWCTACLKSLIEVYLRDESLHPLRCCKNPFALPTISTQLASSKRLLEQYNAKKTEYEVPAQNRVCKENEAVDQVRALARESGWQTCPGCFTVVDLHHGCNHMTCTCHTEFCFICGVKWKECTCPQWDEERLLDTARMRAQNDLGARAREAEPVRFQERVERMAENLRVNHGCVFHSWRGTGPGNCEECGDYMPVFLKMCRTCNLMASPNNLLPLENTQDAMQDAQSYLVLGGNGFVGSHIVQRLLARGEKLVAVYSRSKPPARKLVEGVEYYTGDITDQKRLVEVMLECRATVVFNTVSPPHNDDEHMYYKVNVEGTKAVISACEEAGVPVLIYTSSSGVVWSGKPINGATEDEIEVPEEGLEAYSHTKGIGERAVLEANGERLRTAALRPHAIVGPGDQQAIWRLVENYTSGQYHFQIGNGKNLFSTVSVRDVAQAHLLAADALLNPLRRDQVGGQAFFITDGKPIPFYHYPHLVWWELGAPKDFWVVPLPRWFCFVLALFVESWHKVFGGHTILTRFIITTVTMEQWYSCEKAERLLGYKPSVTLEEAVRETVQWWKAEGAQEHAAHACCPLPLSTIVTSIFIAEALSAPLRTPRSTSANRTNSNPNRNQTAPFVNEDPLTHNVQFIERKVKASLDALHTSTLPSDSKPFIFVSPQSCMADWALPQVDGAPSNAASINLITDLAAVKQAATRIQAKRDFYDRQDRDTEWTGSPALKSYEADLTPEERELDYHLVTLGLLHPRLPRPGPAASASFKSSKRLRARSLLRSLTEPSLRTVKKALSKPFKPLNQTPKPEATEWLPARKAKNAHDISPGTMSTIERTRARAKSCPQPFVKPRAVEDLERIAEVKEPPPETSLLPQTIRRRFLSNCDVLRPSLILLALNKDVPASSEPNLKRQIFNKPISELTHEDVQETDPSVIVQAVMEELQRRKEVKAAATMAALAARKRGTYAIDEGSRSHRASWLKTVSKMSPKMFLAVGVAFAVLSVVDFVLDFYEWWVDDEGAD
ncbi:hypothetical protein NMY22_g12165 [Coprinellus aureogranulatus]|nr:hypothetical protein NMY22_g12165 [Coprinellus aureogranulatus]